MHQIEKFQKTLFQAVQDAANANVHPAHIYVILAQTQQMVLKAMEAPGKPGAPGQPATPANEPELSETDSTARPGHN